ncbi:MAG TPA: acyloxyacyl hydrolase [Flavipsychrobacter sp.]|nr:acyloxyacyl hydrolase [Flavipsychrobacter sp.]
MRRLYFLLLLFLPPFVSFAQTPEKGAGVGLETNFIAGKVFKHTPRFTAPIPDLTTAAELNIVWQTDGKESWQQRSNYPQVGLGMTVVRYGLDAIYGKCYSIYPNVQIPLLHTGRVAWTLRLGFGLSYMTKRYETAPNWDTVNNAIGSHINNFSIFNTTLRYKINKHWDVQAGAVFFHVSNASLRLPNMGINTVGAQVGLRYFPVSSEPEKIVRDLPGLKSRWLLQVRVGLSAVEYAIQDGPLYPVYIGSIYASKRYAGKNKFYIGLDASYHSHIYAFQVNNEINVGSERSHSWKSAVFAGNEFLIGRFGVMTQIGFYWKQAMLRLAPYYLKLGTNIYILQQEKGLVKELCYAVLLKTHQFQAEFVEMGLGIGF